MAGVQGGAGLLARLSGLLPQPNARAEFRVRRLRACFENRQSRALLGRLGEFGTGVVIVGLNLV
jgi:hypothetical protein